MKVTFILILLTAALLVTPVTAVTYSDEYYKLSNQSNIWYTSKWFYPDDSSRSGNPEFHIATIGTFIELRRQTILMEKQNELLEEQNDLARMQMGMVLQCTSKGFAMYGGCTEYAWVKQGWV